MSTLSKFVASLRPEWGRDSMMDDINTNIVEIDSTSIRMCERFSRSLSDVLR